MEKQLAVLRYMGLALLAIIIVAGAWWSYRAMVMVDELATYRELTEMRHNVQMMHTATIMGAYHPEADTRAAWLSRAMMIRRQTLRQFEEMEAGLPPQTVAELRPLLQEYGELAGQDVIDMETLSAIFIKLDRQWKLLIEARYDVVAFRI